MKRTLFYLAGLAVLLPMALLALYALFPAGPGRISFPPSSPWMPWSACFGGMPFWC